jgi:hypothetical protein
MAKGRERGSLRGREKGGGKRESEKGNDTDHNIRHAHHKGKDSKHKISTLRFPSLWVAGHAMITLVYDEKTSFCQIFTKHFDFFIF